jgi:hypothetical protein
MALLDMSVEQGVRGVQHFTDHVFSKDSVGNMIVIALRSLQIYLGVVSICWRTQVSGFHISQHAG